MSETYQNLSHSKWVCKYHVVFVPKRRWKTIFGQRRRQLGAIFHALVRQKECQIIEGHLNVGSCPHVHRHSAQAPGRFGDRVPEREKAPSLRLAWAAKNETSQASFLGPRSRSIDRRLRTGSGSHLHPRATSCGLSRAKPTNEARNARRLDSWPNRL